MSQFTLLCLGSLVLFAVTAWVLWRRQGPSPAIAVPLAMLVYYPLRALLLGPIAAHGSYSVESGVHGQVQHLLVYDQTRAAWLVFVMSGVLLIAVTILTIAPFSAQEQSSRTPIESMSVFTEGWGSLRWWLYIVGLPGLLMQSVSAFAIFSPDVSELSSSGSFAALILYTLHLIGIALILRYSKGLPAALWCAAPAVMLAVVAGSKDGIFILAIVIGSGLYLRALKNNYRLAGSAMLWIALGALSIIYIGFPFVTAFRIGVVERNMSVTDSLVNIVDTLSRYSTISHRPRQPEDPLASGLLVDPLILLSNRLHGFDSLLIVSNTPRDPSFLTSNELLLLPLSFLPFSWVTDNPPDMAVGLRFARTYWGLPSNTDIHIAIGTFPQSYLVYGVFGLIVTTVFWAIGTVLCGRLYRKGSVSSVLLGMMILLSTISFERDILTVAMTLTRRLAVFACVYLVVAGYMDYLKSRSLEKPKRGAALTIERLTSI